MASFTRLKSGKFRARVRVNGQYRGESFSSKAAAKRWAANIEGQLTDQAAGITRKVAGMTVGALVRAYIDEVIEMPGNTAGRTKRNALLMLERRLATVRLESLQAGIDQFIVARQKDGAGGVTIAADLSFLSTVLRWASTVKNIAVDDLAARRARSALSLRGLKTRSQKRERLPADAELSALYKHWSEMQRQTIPMQRITKFALASGMRQGEICRIRIEDIDWKNATVLITDRKDPNEKIGNNQTVPLIGDALAIAEAQAGERAQGRLWPYNSHSVSASFQLATKGLGFPDLNFHDLRHAATTSFFKMGLPIELVALITGHKSWENLRRYTQLNAADVHAALKGDK